MSLLQSIYREYKARGFYGIKRFIVKNYFEKPKPIKNFNQYAQYFKVKNGIEIGGLSPIFSKEIPIYKIIEEEFCVVPLREPMVLPGTIEVEFLYKENWHPSIWYKLT